ncbi:MAG: LUD domain-containing protein, partial [Omnitrophica WOR_2 bacterium]
MPDPFHSRIRSALKNPNLQAALDDNAERRRQAREQAFGDLPDAEALRRRAHAVRAETIASLDRYLEQFVANVSAHGITVHRAADASQAIQIILEIASQRKASRIAKSKTMVSEEIELNPALEKAGLEVVETDLGEYIVQLRGERPGHLITPAVHLRRQD